MIEESKNEVEKTKKDPITKSVKKKDTTTPATPANIIDSSDKWLPADQVFFDAIVPTATSETIFKCKAISYAATQRHEQLSPMPETPYNSSDKATALEWTQAYERRRALAIEEAWQPLPGSTPTEKLEWIRNNIARTGDMDKFYQEVCDKSAWYANPLTSSKIGSETTVEEDDGPKVFESPEDWAKDSQRQVYFCLKVRGDVMKFPLTAVNGAVSDKITRETDIGLPPMKPKKTASGIKMHEELGLEADHNDPAYIRKSGRKLAERKARYIEAALAWDIPGKTYEEKIAWLYARPMGEVDCLYLYVTQELSNTRDRLDFSFGG